MLCKFVTLVVSHDHNVLLAFCDALNSLSSSEATIPLVVKEESQPQGGSNTGSR